MMPGTVIHPPPLPTPRQWGAATERAGCLMLFRCGSGDRSTIPQRRWGRRDPSWVPCQETGDRGSKLQFLLLARGSTVTQGGVVISAKLAEQMPSSWTSKPGIWIFHQLVPPLLVFRRRGERSLIDSPSGQLGWKSPHALSHGPDCAFSAHFPILHPHSYPPNSLLSAHSAHPSCPLRAQARE